ncbi:hypothetical protein Tco_1546922 [Tanacetum coccineum]
MQSQRWTDINAGIQQHLQKLYNTNKASLKAAHWVINPETGTYDVESIKQQHTYDWDAKIDFYLNDPRNQARAAQNRQNRAKSTIMLRLQRLSSKTETGVPYTEEEIMAIIRKGKQRGHLPGVGRVLSGRATDGCPPPPQSTVDLADVEKLKKSNKNLTKQFESSPVFEGASGSGGCGDDESGGDEDGDEDEEDGDSPTKSLWKVARESIPGELSHSTYPGRHVARDWYPQRQEEGIFRMNAENSQEEDVIKQLNIGFVRRGIDVSLFGWLDQGTLN